MIRIKAPDNTQFERFKKIFLAGSIEQGAAELWQDKVSEALSDEKVIIYDPRRDDWDSTWVQDPSPGTQFSEQVNWELDHIAKSDLVLFYFDPNTQSPITLLELGLVLGQSKNCIISCNENYFRYGNVKIICNRHRAVVVNSKEELVSEARMWLSNFE